MLQLTAVICADPFRGAILLPRKESEEKMLPSDPDMLASFLNMKLRDHYSSLDKLCDDMELNKEEIVSKLKEADYDYIPERNQFV